MSAVRRRLDRARKATGPLTAAARAATGRASRGGGVVLCYHDVVAGPEVDLELNVTVTQLRRQLTLVRRLGYRFVGLAELTERTLAGQPVDGLAAVSFDDALAGVARHALPVLTELDVPATLCTVSTVWGQVPRWWPGSDRTMSRQELQEAVGLGLRLAGHTRTHASLPGLAAATLREEVSGCRAELEDLVQTPVDVFAYPFGHHDPAVREAVVEAGFVAAYTFLNGRVTGAEDRLKLPRFTMGHHHDRLRLGYHLSRAVGSWPDHQGDRVTGDDRIT